jgi:hypothetical protein
MSEMVDLLFDASNSFLECELYPMLDGVGRMTRTRLWQKWKVQRAEDAERDTTRPFSADFVYVTREYVRDQLLSLVSVRKDVAQLVGFDKFLQRFCAKGLFCDFAGFHIVRNALRGPVSPEARPLRNSLKAKVVDSMIKIDRDGKLGCAKPEAEAIAAVYFTWFAANVSVSEGVWTEELIEFFERILVAPSELVSGFETNCFTVGPVLPVVVRIGACEFEFRSKRGRGGAHAGVDVWMNGEPFLVGKVSDQAFRVHTNTQVGPSLLPCDMEFDHKWSSLDPRGVLREETMIMTPIDAIMTAFAGNTGIGLPGRILLASDMFSGVLFMGRYHPGIVTLGQFAWAVDNASAAVKVGFLKDNPERVSWLALSGMLTAAQLDGAVEHQLISSSLSTAVRAARLVRGRSSVTKLKVPALVDLFKIPIFCKCAALADCEENDGNVVFGFGLASALMLDFSAPRLARLNFARATLRNFIIQLHERVVEARWSVGALITGMYRGPFGDQLGRAVDKHFRERPVSPRELVAMAWNELVRDVTSDAGSLASIVMSKEAAPRRLLDLIPLPPAKAERSYVPMSAPFALMPFDAEAFKAKLRPWGAEFAGKFLPVVKGYVEGGLELRDPATATSFVDCWIDTTASWLTWVGDALYDIANGASELRNRIPPPARMPGAAFALDSPDEQFEEYDDDEPSASDEDDA